MRSVNDRVLRQLPLRIIFSEPLVAGNDFQFFSFFFFRLNISAVVITKRGSTGERGKFYSRKKKKLFPILEQQDLLEVSRK